MSLTIRPIITGWIGSFQNRLTNCREDGKAVKLPSVCWLIEGAQKPILIDTGMCDSERASRWHHSGSVQEPGQAVHEQLFKFGLAPEDIQIIIFTHLHWDHVQNLDKFPDATLYVHQREWEFANAPIPPYYNSYEHPILGITPPFLRRAFELIDGEDEIVPGITVFPTPGHSPGSMSVQVKTAKGNYVIAGDAVMCNKNLEGDPDKHMRYFPIGRYVNFFEMWKSFKEIDTRADFVLPGHEPAIVEKDIYP